MLKALLPVIFLILVWSTGQCSDPIGSVPENRVFFADQTPVLLADADDEWGTSTTTPKLTEQTEGYKSPSRAVLYSFLLPGLGEIYVGDSRLKTVGFLTAEVGIWSSFVFFRHLGKWKKDDYIEYAAVYAGVDPSGKDDEFYDMVGFYSNRDEYNKVSRVYTRENPFYPETSSWDWQWLDESYRDEYRDIKNDSKAAYRNANFALGAAALNRAVAMVFAWRSARAHNRNLVNEFSKFNLEVLPDYRTESLEVRLNYSTSF